MFARFELELRAWRPAPGCGRQCVAEDGEGVVSDVGTSGSRRRKDWVKARAESETKYGGSLTVDGGVMSTYMNATDYSPTK